MKRRVFMSAVFFIALAALSQAGEPIRLANIFSSGCVLQRDRTVEVWGTCEPNKKVTLTIKNQSITAEADSNGRWRIELNPEPAGGPFTMKVSGTDGLSVELADVYFGDVWILTGQSNMYQDLAGHVKMHAGYYPPVPNESDNFDDVRLAIVANVTTNAPSDDATMKVPWSRWEAGSLSNMSTVGYFFARYLNEKLDANGLGNIPLGIIKVCKGSTSIEQWIAADDLAATGLPKPGDSSGYYNGMVAPIQDYAIKGALWYQGEGNTGSISEITNYFVLKQTLINSWCRQWNNPDMPFYFVQLAPYHPHYAVMNDVEKDLQDKDKREVVYWPWMREIQTKCLEIPNTAMACTIDSGFQDYIHPPFKDRVGERLARIALAKTYGLPFVCRGPTVKNVEFNGSKVIITFDNVAVGLRTQAVDSQPDAKEIALGYPPVSVSSNELAGFALCGKDQVFYWADKTEIISSNQVQISSADVHAPVAVRYAWQNYPRCNLFNSEGLPAEPFRTDEFKYGTSSGAESTSKAKEKSVGAPR